MEHWSDMMSYVNCIASLKQSFGDSMMDVFWNSGVVSSVVKSMHKAPNCFICHCKLLSLFASGCPDENKSSLLRQCMHYYDLFKYGVGSAKDKNVPTPDEMTAMDEDLDRILQVCCSDVLVGARCMFNAIVNDNSNDGFPADSMLIESNAVDKTVRRLFDQGVKEANNQLVVGMCIAYIAMCARNSATLPQLIADLRSHLALSPADPVFNFGGERIANIIIFSIDSSSFSPEAESLLAACFAKCAPFTASDSLSETIDEAMKFVVTATGPVCASVLQKLYVLACSPTIASLFTPYMDVIRIVAEEAGKSGEKYYQFLCSVLPRNLEQHKDEQEDEEDDSATAPPPPSYEEHLQNQQQQQQQQPPPKPQQSDSDDDDGDDKEDGPVGLPPSDMN